MKYFYGEPDKELYYAQSLNDAIEELQISLYDDSPNEYDIVEMAVSKSGEKFCMNDNYFIDTDICGKNNCDYYMPKSNNHCKYLSHSLYQTGRKWHIRFTGNDDVTKYELEKISGRNHKNHLTKCNKVIE